MIYSYQANDCIEKKAAMSLLRILHIQCARRREIKRGGKSVKQKIIYAKSTIRKLHITAAKIIIRSENAMNTPRLETERLVLRKFTEEDITALFLILKDEEVNKFLPWYPVKDLKETEKFYAERYEAVYKQPQGYAYAVCLKADNIPIGYIQVDTEESHDFGYGLRREFWHRGITTEAGKAVAEQVKRDGLPYITATHDRNNPRSGNVMKKVGMKYCYSYEEQWQPKNFPVIFRMYQLNLDGREDRVYRKYWNMYENHFIEQDI